MVPTGLALLVSLVAKVGLDGPGGDGGLTAADTNALGAFSVAIGGSLGLVGAARGIPRASEVSWACVSLGGWIIAIASSSLLWCLLPG